MSEVKDLELRFSHEVGEDQIEVMRRIAGPGAIIVISDDRMGATIKGIQADSIPQVAMAIIARGDEQADSLPVDDWSAFESSFDTDKNGVEVPQNFGVDA